MNKHKWLIYVLSLTILLVLSGCMGSKEKNEPIEPDVEPNEVTIPSKAKKEKESDGLTMLEATSFYEEGRMLDEYKELFKEAGYEKPYKTLSLFDHGEYRTGIIYDVEDGYSMIEYNDDMNHVEAITGFQTEQEIMLVEMKVEAFELEDEMEHEEDPSKKEEFQKTLDEMWEEIGSIENSEN